MLQKAILTSLMAVSFFCVLACAPTADRTPSGQNTGLDACNITFSQTGYCAHFIWETVPSSTEVGTFFLEFYKLDDPGITVNPPGDLVVFYQLEGGASPARFAKSTLTNPGQYRVDGLNFDSAGHWDIHLQLRNTPGNEDQVFKYNRL